MPQQIRICQECHSTEYPPLADAEPGEPVEITEVFCENCSEWVTERYCRPGRALDRRTLADALLESFNRLLIATNDGSHPYTEDSLLEPSAHTMPSAQQLRRDSVELVEALRRVGETVCFSRPAWEDEEIDIAFHMAGVTPEGGAFQRMTDACEVYNMFGCVNGYDYAPDGSPLSEAT